MRSRLPPFLTEPSSTYRTPSSRPTCLMSTALPLYVNEELRAIKNHQRMHDSPVMMSSTRPSAKYSCSGSPLMFWNGSTAIDGLSGNGSGTCGTAAGETVASDVTGTCQSDGSHFTPNA